MLGVEGLCVAGLVWRALVWALCWGASDIQFLFFWQTLMVMSALRNEFKNVFFIMTLTL